MPGAQGMFYSSITVQADDNDDSIIDFQIPVLLYLSFNMIQLYGHLGNQVQLQFYFSIMFIIFSPSAVQFIATFYLMNTMLKSSLAFNLGKCANYLHSNYIPLSSSLKVEIVLAIVNLCAGLYSTWKASFLHNCNTVQHICCSTW